MLGNIMYSRQYGRYVSAEPRNKSRGLVADRKLNESLVQCFSILPIPCWEPPPKDRSLDGLMK